MGHKNARSADLTRSYRVGRDRTGRWLAMETSGRSGGMFATREAAVRFAQFETSFRPGAVAMVSEAVWFV